MSLPLVTFDAPLVQCDWEKETYQEILGDRGKKLLIQAVKDGELEIVRRLLLHGGDVNICDGYMNTILHYACYFGHVEITKLLFVSGAQINALNHAGNTPLHLSLRE